MATCRMCVALELSTLASSQYTWKMAGLEELSGVGYGGDEDGFYSLTGNDDAGVDIDASFKLITTDFGSLNQKRIRHLYFGYQSDDDLTVTVTADEYNSMVKELSPAPVGSSHGRKLTVDRNIKGRYFDVEVSNHEGCDFSIDSIDALVLSLVDVRTT